MKIPRRPTRLLKRLLLVRGRFRRNKPGKLSLVLLQIRLLFWIFCKALIRDANAAFVFIASMSSGSYYHLRMPSRRCLWFANRFQRHWTMERSWDSTINHLGGTIVGSQRDALESLRLCCQTMVNFRKKMFYNHSGGVSRVVVVFHYSSVAGTASGMNSTSHF